MGWRPELLLLQAMGEYVQGPEVQNLARNLMEILKDNLLYIGAAILGAGLLLMYLRK